MGGTLLFVSHNLGLVRSMTDRTVWLDHGKVMGDGQTRDVVADYSKAMESRTAALIETKGRRGGGRKAIRGMGLYRWGAGGGRVNDVRILGGTGNAAGDGSPDHDEPLEFTIDYEISELDRAVFCVGFLDEVGREIGGSTSEPVEVQKGTGSVRCSIRPIPFRSGVYFPVVGILSVDGTVHDRWRLDRAVVVDRNGEVTSAQELGPVAIDGSWAQGPVSVAALGTP